MGLRCLLGHEYANREVEREREERGNEVVVTYRTVETCDRCGERRIVSENKEVRPVRNPAEDEVTTGLGNDGRGSVTPDLGDGDEASSGADAGADAEGDGTREPESTPEPDPETADPAGADQDPPSEPTSAPTTTDDDLPESGTDDGGIILDDGPDDEGGSADEGDRLPGEWPEASESEPDADADGDDGTTVVGDEGWPEPVGEDEGFDAEPSDGEPTDVSFGGGMTPERADGATNGEAGAAAAANGTAAGSIDGKQFVAAETVEHVGEENAAETEFFCPNCGYARDAGGSSMRAGDICPDCHKGYIAERER